MGIDMIIGIIFFVGVGVLEIFQGPILRRLRLQMPETQLGSKLMVAFLAGFIFFILLTDKMPQPWQKVPVIVVSLLLIWANLFLPVGKREEDEEKNEEKANV